MSKMLLTVCDCIGRVVEKTMFGFDIVMYFLFALVERLKVLLYVTRLFS